MKLHDIFRDSAGQDDYNRLRPLGYADADVFLLCYSISDRDSYKNVEQRVLIYSSVILIVVTRTEIECAFSTNNFGCYKAGPS